MKQKTMKLFKTKLNPSLEEHLKELPPDMNEVYVALSREKSANEALKKLMKTYL